MDSENPCALSVFLRISRGHCHCVRLSNVILQGCSDLRLHLTHQAQIDTDPVTSTQ